MIHEMKKLRKMLDNLGIEWHDASDNSIDRTHFDYRGYNWSVVHGCGTYGEHEGLLELMSEAVDCGEPVGFLRAEDVANLMKEVCADEQICTSQQM